MEFEDLLRKRRSVRAYLEAPVEDEKIRLILEAAQSAPSAGNLQSYKIVVVNSPEAKEKICHASSEQASIMEAPVCLVFFADQKRSAAKYGEWGATLYCIQDATIAAAYAQLAAANLGLGSVWVGAFEDGEVVEALGAAEGEIPIAIIPIGYPAEEGRQRSRRPGSEVVRES